MRCRVAYLAVASVVAALSLVPGRARAEPPPAFPAGSPAPAAATNDVDPRYRDLLPFGMRGRGLPRRDWLETGLAFLRRLQREDGGWRAGDGYRPFDLGVTSLASLAFLGAGVAPGEANDSGRSLAKGIDLLVAAQGDDGCVGDRSDQRFVYVHAFASIALVEAFAATGDVKLRHAAQKALDFISVARNPGLGWRYGVKPGDNDTSVTGCMLLALHEARLVNRAAVEAALPIPLDYAETAVEGAAAWIDGVTDPDTGRVGYDKLGTLGQRADAATEEKFPVEKSDAMTAIGVFDRTLRGGGRRGPSALADTRIAKGVFRLAQSEPWGSTSYGSFDLYYYFWGSLAMRSVGGKDWANWLRALQSRLPAMIALDDYFWETCDPWSRAGGPVYAMSMALLTLEVGERFEWAPEERLEIVRCAGPDRAPEVRAVALRALAVRPSKETASVAAAALTSRDLPVRRAGARALLAAATRADAAALARAVADPDDEVAVNAVLAAGRVRAVPAVAGLATALGSSSLRLKCSALWALGEIGVDAASAGDAVRPLLEDPLPVVQVEAARALWLLRGGAVPSLERVMSYVASDDAFLRVRALRAIEAFGLAAATAADAAQGALGSADADTSVAASDALRAMGREARGARIALQEAALFGESSAIRAAATRALEGMESPLSGVPARGAAPTVAKPPIPGSASALAALLKDPATAAALRPSLRTAEAVPLLVPLLDHADEDVRVRAAEALGDLGTAAKDATAPLLRLAGRDEPRGATAAMRALARVAPGAAEAVPALRIGLSSRSADVRAAALEAISTWRSAPDGVVAVLGMFAGRDARPQVLLALHCSVRWGADDARVRTFLPAFDSAPYRAIGALARVRPLTATVASFLLGYADEQTQAGHVDAWWVAAAADSIADVGRTDAAVRTAIVEYWRAHPPGFADVVLGALGRTIAAAVAASLGDADPARPKIASGVLRRIGFEDAAPAIPTIVSKLRMTWGDEVFGDLAHLFAFGFEAPGRAALVGALANSNPQVRGGAAVLMGRIAADSHAVVEYRDALDRARRVEKDGDVRDCMDRAYRLNKP